MNTYKNLALVPIQKNEGESSNLRSDKGEWRELLHELKGLLNLTELGVTPKEWADELGVSSRLVQYWRSGMMPIQKKYLFEIAMKALRAEEEVQKKLEWARIFCGKIINLYRLDEIKGQL